MPGPRSLPGAGWLYLDSGPFQWVCSGGGYVQGVFSRGWVYQRGGVGIPEGVDGVGMYTARHGTIDTHSAPVLTPSGSHHNMYGWQMGDTNAALFEFILLLDGT